MISDKHEGERCYRDDSLTDVFSCLFRVRVEAREGACGVREEEAESTAPLGGGTSDPARPAGAIEADAS